MASYIKEFCLRGKIDRILRKVTKITNLTMLFLFTEYNTVYRFTKFPVGCRKMKIRLTKPRSVIVEYKNISYGGVDWFDKTRVFINQLEELF